MDLPDLLQVQNLLRRITLVIPQQELEGLSSFKTLICLSSVKYYCLIRTWHEFYPPITPLSLFIFIFWRVSCWCPCVFVYNESHRHIVSLPGFQSVFLFARLPVSRSIYAQTSVYFSSQLALTVVISCNCRRDVLNSQCGIWIFFNSYQFWKRPVIYWGRRWTNP